MYWRVRVGVGVCAVSRLSDQRGQKEVFLDLYDFTTTKTPKISPETKISIAIFTSNNAGNHLTLCSTLIFTPLTLVTSSESVSPAA